MWPVVVLDDVVFPAQSKQYHDVTAWRKGEMGSSSGAVLSRREACVLLAVILLWYWRAGSQMVARRKGGEKAPGEGKEV
jgi:hypothetical protein